MFKKILLLLTVMACMSDAVYASYTMSAEQEKNVKTSVNINKNEFWTGYWNGVSDYNTITFGQGTVPMTYDAAIGYPKNAEALKGLTVEGFRFAFSKSKNISDVKVWMSTSLPKTPEEADIVCQTVDESAMPKDGSFNEIRFDKPYLYNPDKELYIGYSFEVKQGKGDVDKFPIVIQSGVDDQPMAAIFRMGGAGSEWMDYNGLKYGVLAVQILVSGDFRDNDVTMNPEAGSMVATKGQFDLPLTVKNTGINGIESITVLTDVNGVKTECDVKPAKKITGFGTPYEFKAPVNTPGTTGRCDFTVKITKINGTAAASDISARGSMLIVTREAKHRVFVEEFTGMWCGWCPKGIVGLQKLHQVYGDDIVLAAIHSKDDLTCNDYAEIVSNNTFSYPNAYIDRNIMGTDPYEGTSGEIFGIKNDVEACASVLPVAEITPKYTLDGKMLKAEADVKFLFTGDASDYSLAYILTEDGMQNDSWYQDNYYAMYGGQGIEYSEPLFEPWVNGSTKQKGVVFNEIAIAAKGIDNGIAGSIPAEVTEETSYNHSVTFNLDDYKVIQNTDNMHLQVVLINTVTGKIVNANAVSLVDTAIDGVTSDDNVTETARYTIDGRRVDSLHRGITLVKYSDGSVKKVMVR